MVDLSIERHEMPVQPPEQRRCNFDEVALLCSPPGQPGEKECCSLAESHIVGGPRNERNCPPGD